MLKDSYFPQSREKKHSANQSFVNCTTARKMENVMKLTGINKTQLYMLLQVHLQKQKGNCTFKTCYTHYAHTDDSLHSDNTVLEEIHQIIHQQAC